MDLGNPFKRTMVIQPGEDGTFIVLARRLEDKLEREFKFGFSSIDDLLIWMAKHGTKSRVTELKEGDVVRGGLVGMDALNGLRRTTAAEIIAERAARQDNGSAARAFAAAAQQRALDEANSASDAMRTT